MDKKRQLQAPIYSALERFRKQRVVPFDVPGHKRGRGVHEAGGPGGKSQDAGP